MNTQRQFGTFAVGPFWFCVAAEEIQEVLAPIATTPIPRTTDVVTGLVNLRGQILLAVDLRARLDQPCASTATTISLIVHTADGPVSLRVDALGDIVTLDEATRIEPLPENVGGPVRDITRGLIKQQNRLLLVLDPDRVVTTDACLIQYDQETL